jgi:uncharacterized protein
MKHLLVVVVSLAVLIGSASSAASGDLGKQLIEAAKKGNANTVRALLDRGADVNAKNKDGFTVLMVAGNAEIVRLLIDKGADVNAKDNSGRTASGLAASKHHANIAQMLKNPPK